MGRLWVRIVGWLRRLFGAKQASVQAAEILPVEPMETQTAALRESQTVLIGTLRSADQFSACIHHNFYYIPAYLVPEEVLPIHYVALFRTPRVFGKFSGVYCYGVVTSCKYVLRKEITEVPVRQMNRSEVPYYRLSVASWIALECPIPPGDTGFVCAFTTRNALLEAQDTSEFLLSIGELSDYRRLKDAALHHTAWELPCCMGEGLTARIGKGKIRICRENEILAQCDMQAFRQRPYVTFRDLQLQLLQHVVSSS